MATERLDAEAQLAERVSRLERELAATRGDLAEARQQRDEAQEQQSATSAMLRVIASSSTDLRAVLDAVAESAARLSEANDALIYRLEDGVLVHAASHGPLAGALGQVVSDVDRHTVPGRVMVDRRTIHIRDIAAEPEDDLRSTFLRGLGVRTVLASPLLRDGSAVGVIMIRRLEVRPFSEQQVKLLETFADQAVIAIENTRLFNELRDRNRDLSEALEQQTATADILRVISSSPTDVQPVFGTIAERAVDLCGAEVSLVSRLDGELIRLVGIHGLNPDAVRAVRRAFPLSLSAESVTSRAVRERAVVHIPDVLEDLSYGYKEEVRAGGYRRGLSVPMVREGQIIGVIFVGGAAPGYFSERQVGLLKTFADQAVIAIENTRLFGELQDRVGELQALGEVGQAVSSTLDLNQVLGTVIAHADRLSGTDGGVLYEYDEQTGEFRLRATRRLDDDVVGALRAAPVRLGEGAVGRAALAREPVQIADITAEGAYRGRLLEAMVAAGHRAVLAVPLLAEGRILGGLVVVRKTPGEFPRNVIELAGTFAAQSALAIQNARLYREVEEKSLQLELASKHKSEFLANMSHELRTPLNAIIGFSEVLLERLFGDVNDRQAEYLADILTSGQHLLSLINDILDLSKVEAGRMDLEVREFSLREALENGLTMLKERAGRHGIALALDIEDGLDVIDADERKVKQVVFNLLSNAVKFTPDGGRVDVTARRTDGGVEVAVRDTGVGIAPEDLPHVFDEFRQVGDGAAKAEGTGLGLALTKKLVELHGGTIWAESVVGAGSTFAFALPIRSPDRQPAQGGC